MSNGRGLTLCSGGLDSSCLVAYLKIEKNMKVYPLFIDRRQRSAAQEKTAFDSIIRRLGLLENAFYASYDVSQIPSENMPGYGGERGFIRHPERNLVLVSMAYGFAAALKTPTVYVACNADDGGSDIPDSRPDFFRQVTLIFQMLKPKGKIELPFAEWSKAKIIRWASEQKELGSEFLQLTRSCWEDTSGHCGKCNACELRKDAFKKAAVEDPTIYEP